jgi:hypothetical protein
LELCIAHSDDALDELRGELERAISTAPGASSASVPRCQRFKHIGRADRDGILELSWPLRPAAQLPFALALAAAALSLYGAHLQDGRVPFLVGAAVSAGLAALLLAWTAVRALDRQRIVVTDEELCAERVRFQRVVSVERVPLHDIATLDYRHRLHAHGQALVVRTRQEEEELSAIRAGEHGAATALLRMLQGQMQIRCGNLSLPAKLALGLALGDAISKRQSPKPSGDG